MNYFGNIQVSLHEDKWLPLNTDVLCGGHAVTTFMSLQPLTSADFRSC